jgi:hypothetical protein
LLLFFFSFAFGELRLDRAWGCPLFDDHRVLKGCGLQARGTLGESFLAFGSGYGLAAALTIGILILEPSDDLEDIFKDLGRLEYCFVVSVVSFQDLQLVG